MPEDQVKKREYESAAHEKKQERIDIDVGEVINTAVLRGDHGPGEHGVLPPEQALRDASEIKELYALLPDFHKDELRRVFVLPPGALLRPGQVLCDVRVRDRGALIADGEEEVQDELLVPKDAVDYEIWDKLINREAG